MRLSARHDDVLRQIKALAGRQLDIGVAVVVLAVVDADVAIPDDFQLILLDDSGRGFVNADAEQRGSRGERGGENALQRPLAPMGKDKGAVLTTARSSCRNGSGSHNVTSSACAPSGPPSSSESLAIEMGRRRVAASARAVHPAS